MILQSHTHDIDELSHEERIATRKGAGVKTTVELVTLCKTVADVLNLIQQGPTIFCSLCRRLFSSSLMKR